MKKRSLILGLAVVALALAAGNATAGGRSNSTDCSPALTKPFMPWLDFGSYFLAPGGDFESGLGGWTTTGSARVVAGNESYFVTSSADDQSLSLPSGSSVTTPAMCVSLDSPDFRLFVRNTGSLLSLMTVAVNYTDASGRKRSLPLVPLAAGSSWSLSLPELMLANIPSILSSNGHTSVSFTLAPVGAGKWQVDDFYVDPIKHQ
jgi:hypothetical protein